MADLISRAAAKFQACNWNVKPNDFIFDGIKEAIKTQLDMAPAVDAVPVVRCRDCKHGETTHNARGEAVIKCEEICWLCRLPRLMEPDWFCANGERRDSE
jgi:hypothetical protein